MLRTLISIVSLLLISSATLADRPLPPEFAACSRIQTNGERLACYDRAVAYLSQPAEQQTSAPSPEASFGLQASVPQPPAADAKDDEVSSIHGRVTEVSTDREGKKVMTLDALEFLRRFLMHVLPDRFVRIRYFGFLSNGQRVRRVALARELMVQTAVAHVREPRQQPILCPACRAKAAVERTTRPSNLVLRSPPVADAA